MSAMLIGVILTELYANLRGVGCYIRHYSDIYKSHNLFALVPLVSVAGIAMTEVSRRAEQHFSR